MQISNGMAYHEDYLEGSTTSIYIYRVLFGVLLTWSKSDHQAFLDALGGERLSDQRKSGKASQVYSALLKNQSLDLVVEDVKDKVYPKDCPGA